MSDNNATDAYVTAEWIRRPLVDLGGISPTDAVGDSEARKKLEDLLVELAGHHIRMTRLGLPAIDPGEIRKALGIEHAPAFAPSRAHARPVRSGPVKRNALLDELGTALTGGDMDSAAFFNAKTGAVEHFMHNLGDQENERIAQAQSDPDLKKVVPVTTEVRYGIMSDFIANVEDIAFAGKLRGAISGKGAFRRFRETVDEDDAMRRRWLAYRTKRHYHLALDWLHKIGADPSRYALNITDFDWEAPEHAPASALEPEAAKAEQTDTPVPESVTNAAVESAGEPAGEPAQESTEEPAAEPEATSSSPT